MSEKLHMIFEVVDADHSGELSCHEFVSGLTKINGINELKLKNGSPVTQDLLRLVAQSLDHSGDGAISLMELLEGFSFEDECGGDMAGALCDHILVILLRHRQAIRAGCVCFDPAHEGTVSRDNFAKVLTSLDKALSFPDRRTGSPIRQNTAKTLVNTAPSNEHLVPSQIEHLCDALCEDGGQGGFFVRYEEFFDSFEVIDTENPSISVKLGKRKKHA